MAFVQADVDALDAAYKTGAESVRLADGQSVTYRSYAEYWLLRQQMQLDLVVATGRPRILRLYPSYSKGIL